MIKNLARLYSAELVGIDAKIIEVEADINVGLHAFNIVGLADKSLNEAKERVNSALKNSGIKPPNRENRKITINLAPADVKKTGSHYDLAIALGYLLATGQVQKFDTSDKIFLGELALDGRLRNIVGALSIAQRAADLGFKFLFLPKENANEAAVVSTIKIIAVENIQEVIQILEGRKVILEHVFQGGDRKKNAVADFSEIRGQENAKRALTIAAAGNHNILMSGPPGVGKSFLARTLVGIMPDLDLNESVEITKIWSAAGLNNDGLIWQRPFRAPHQTISVHGLIGGGQDPKPGEISLAHGGILFLDELPEFQRSTLESIRQPMESGVIQIARLKESLLLPAHFILVAAMNPCPCGYYGDAQKECSCSAYEVMRYQKKISGPLLDRIDIKIKIGRIAIQELQKGSGEMMESPMLKNLVESARERQAQRSLINGEMSSREIQTVVNLKPDAEVFLKTLEHKHLSPRGYYRLLKVARTIADLDAEERVSADHLAEAFSYRFTEES